MSYEKRIAVPNWNRDVFGVNYLQSKMLFTQIGIVVVEERPRKA